MNMLDVIQLLSVFFGTLIAAPLVVSKKAKNDFILFIDDDLYPDEYLLSDILMNVKKDGFKNNKNCTLQVSLTADPFWEK